jgi:hypothetical protein
MIIMIAVMLQACAKFAGDDFLCAPFAGARWLRSGGGVLPERHDRQAY